MKNKETKQTFIIYPFIALSLSIYPVMKNRKGKVDNFFHKIRKISDIEVFLFK